MKTINNAIEYLLFVAALLFIIAQGLL